MASDSGFGGQVLPSMASRFKGSNFTLYKDPAHESRFFCLGFRLEELQGLSSKRSDQGESGQNACPIALHYLDIPQLRTRSDLGILHGSNPKPHNQSPKPKSAKSLAKATRNHMKPYCFSVATLTVCLIEPLTIWPQNTDPKRQKM